LSTSASDITAVQTHRTLTSRRNNDIASGKSMQEPRKTRTTGICIPPDSQCLQLVPDHSLSDEMKTNGAESVWSYGSLHELRVRC
jgi:hypothetical protein